MFSQCYQNTSCVVLMAWIKLYIMPIILNNENTLLKFNCILTCYKLLLESYPGSLICQIASNNSSKLNWNAH